MTDAAVTARPTPADVWAEMREGNARFVADLAAPLVALFGTALSVALQAGRAAIANPGAHGFTEILYAFSSAANNNGSAFAGLQADTPYYNLALGLTMLWGRYVVMVAVLALAGALVYPSIVALASSETPLDFFGIPVQAISYGRKRV